MPRCIPIGTRASSAELLALAARGSVGLVWYLEVLAVGDVYGDGPLWPWRMRPFARGALARVGARRRASE